MAAPRAAETNVGELVATTLLGEAVASGGVAAFVCDDDLAYVAANDAACALVAYSRAELLTMRAVEVVDAPEERLLAAAREVSAGFVWAGRTRLRPKDGGAVEVRYVSGPTRLGALGSFIFTLCWPLAAEGRPGDVLAPP